MDFIQQHINTIINADCLDIMRQMPDKCVDLVITSPPYNLLNSSGNWAKSPSLKGRWQNTPLKFNGYKVHSDKMPHADYVVWQRDCLTEMLRLLKDDGAIFYNHKWRVQNGLLQDRQDIVTGFPVRQIIIWQRMGGINFNDSFFLPTYEVIYLIAKPKFKLVKKANGIGDVWMVKQEMNNAHPAPFPLELPERIIKSTDAQIIFDPFIGSGTTAVAAILNGRQFLGVELSQEYADMANTRIASFMGIQRLTNEQKQLQLGL